MINLQNKKVILTGGSRGIGLSILKELNNLNAKILTIGTNETRLSEISKQFPNIIVKKFDISKHDDIENNFFLLVLQQFLREHLNNYDLITQYY